MPQSSSCVSSRQSAGRWESCTAALGLQEVVAQLDSDLNETYLWHGTRVRTGLQIAQDDHRCHPLKDLTLRTVSTTVGPFCPPMIDCSWDMLGPFLQVFAFCHPTRRTSTWPSLARVLELCTAKVCTFPSLCCKKRFLLQTLQCQTEPFIKESSIVGVYLFCCWADPIYGPFSPRKAAPKLMSIAKMSQVDTITVWEPCYCAVFVWESSTTPASGILGHTHSWHMLTP